MEKKEGASDSKHSWFLGSFQSQFVCQYSNYYCMPEEGADWMRLTFSQYHTKHSTIHEVVPFRLPHFTHTLLDSCPL